jgi:hypothetical protein
MALMAAHGLIEPMPQAAIFADTGSEPESVYRWLEWLAAVLPYPIHWVKKGDLADTALKMREKKTGEKWTQSLIPAYTLAKNGKRGHMRRACTVEYKLKELLKAQRRLGSVKRGQRVCTVTSWIGISWDELVRMKPSREPWVQNRWPLVELRMSRNDCLRWMAAQGYPKPPRSACVFCPYHSNQEWQRLKEEEPHEFSKAVEFERALQQTKAQTSNLRSVPYLHNSRIPLEKIDFSTRESEQIPLWGDECLGMCRV